MTARSVYTLAYPDTLYSINGVGYDPRTGFLARSDGTDDMTEVGNAPLKSDEQILQSSAEFCAIQTIFGTACWV